jgi:hypothetical protein
MMFRASGCGLGYLKTERTFYGPCGFIGAEKDALRDLANQGTLVTGGSDGTVRGKARRSMQRAMDGSGASLP